jgi:hypothetical protein
MKKLLIVLFLTFSFGAMAQDEAAVKACIENYLTGITTGDKSKLGTAFHTQAMLRTVNAATGKMIETPAGDFVNKAPAGGLKAKTKIISYSTIGQAAFASVELSLDEFKYIDYLSLLKIGADWKIVCRVYSRAELTAEPITIGGSTAAGKTTGKPATKVKPKSDDGW